MKNNILLLIFFPIITYSQQTIYDSIIHNGVYRQFITYIPDSYDPLFEIPLLFNLHGKSQTAYGSMLYSDFRPISDTAIFMITYPQGLLDNTGDTHWNYGQSSVDDIGFLSSLYNHLITNYNIDTKRVYSSGMSNGGAMSYYLACNMSDKIAAIASVTGAMSSYQHLACNPIHPTPILEIHGTEDTVVTFNSVIPGLLYWRDYNNCELIADTTIIDNLFLGDFSTVEHIIYKNGDNNSTTELFKILGGGHTWPGSFFSQGITNQDIDASSEIWKFFSKFDINGLIGTNVLIDNNTVDNRNLVKILDLLGRKTCNKINEIFIYIYDDGTVEKQIIIE